MARLTADGTMELIEFAPGPQGSDPGEFIVFDDRILVFASDGEGRKLFAVNDTNEFEPISDINGGGHFAEMGGSFYFFGRSATDGTGLFRMDPGSSNVVPVLYGISQYSYRAMHLTPVTQFVVAGSCRSIHARCWSFAIGSRTMLRAGTISPSCGGRKGSAARYAEGRIIGSRRGACVTAGSAVGRPR